MAGVGILIVIAGAVTRIVKGTGDDVLGKEVQDIQTRRGQGTTRHKTVVTTIVPTHLVKRIGTGTIDQSEDPCPQRFAARRPTEERSRRICSAGAILPSHHCAWQWLSLTSIILAPGFCNMQGNQYLLGT